MPNHHFIILRHAGLCSLLGHRNALLCCDTSETNHGLVMLVAT